MIWLLSHAQRRVLARSDAGLIDLGLTSTQAGALFCFRADEGLLIGELADALGLAQSAASGLAARMVEAGLVARTDDPADRRAARLTLTPAGRRARTEAARRANIANTEMMQGFTDGEMAAVVRWLTHVAKLEDGR
jgi:DNA-binding MarR family transcriptional regulator